MNSASDPGNAGRALRVAITAADPIRRLGLAAIVRQAGFEIAESSAESSDRIDVVLTDGDEGPPPGVPVLALGAAEAGQAGLLPRDIPPAQIEAALRAVAAGLVVRAREPPRPAFEEIGEGEPPLLTPREIEVLAAIGNGSSNKAVARRLGISEHTVKFHVESLFRKLGAASRAEAVHKGLSRRLIEM